MCSITYNTQCYVRVYVRLCVRVCLHTDPIKFFFWILHTEYMIQIDNSDYSHPTATITTLVQRSFFINTIFFKDHLMNNNYT